MKRIATRWLIIPVLTVVTFTFAKGQSVARKDTASVPLKLRGQLFHRLALLAKYQSDESFGPLYDMLFGFMPQKLNRLQFIELMRTCRNDAFLGFRLRSIDKSFNEAYPDADWRILGVAIVRDAAGTHKKTAFVFAKLINGQWYFSGIIVPRQEPLICY